MLLGAGALLGLTAGARADNWELLPRIEAGATYNDNYRLADTPVGKVDVYGPYIDAQLSADLLSATSKLDIVPRVHSTFFPADHADQSTDEYLDVTGEHRTLRSLFTGIAQYANQTVIYSELPPATFPGVTLGEPTTGVSGRVGVRNRQQLERAVPRYQYDLTQRMHLNVNADVERVSYDKSVIQEIGYTNYAGGAGLGFDVSPRSVVTVSGMGARFVPQAGGGNDATTYGAQAEWDLRETQIAHFYARLGVNRNNAQATTTDTFISGPPGRTVTPVTTTHAVSSTGVTGGIGVDLRYQITEITVDLLRAVTPSSQGAVLEDEELRFRALHAFQPRFSGFVGVRGMRLRGLSNSYGATVDGEDYVTAEAGFDYQITQSYRIEGAYDYIWQRFVGTPNAS
ncbi:MAG: hypothetical protein ACREFT_07990, partial [Acetobacteraceae bacterium]